MKNEPSPIDGRWVARTDDGSPESRAGALLRRAVSRDAINPGRLAAVKDRLRGARRWPRRHWALRFAIAIGLLLSGGALTAAGQRYLHLFASARPAPQQHAPAAPPRAPRARVVASAPPLAIEPAAETPVPTDEPPAPAPTPVAVAVERRSVLSRTAAPERSDPAAVAPAAFAAPEPSASALAQESELLSQALRKLRQDDDPRGALALLDAHDARYATGPLAPEALRARIEALLRTHRNDDALALLNRAAPAARGSGRDLLVTRAELRAAAGRCSTAAADFDLLLHRDPAPDSITERALWGRAACRATGSDAEGARSDLRDYLARFPEGRFAREARAALGK